MEGETAEQSRGILREKIPGRQVCYMLGAEGQLQVTEEQEVFSALAFTVFCAEFKQKLDSILQIAE